MALVLWPYVAITGFSELEEQSEDHQPWSNNLPNGSIGNMNVEFVSVSPILSFVEADVNGPVLILSDIAQGRF